MTPCAQVRLPEGRAPLLPPPEGAVLHCDSPDSRRVPLTLPEGDVPGSLRPSRIWPKPTACRAIPRRPSKSRAAGCPMCCPRTVHVTPASRRRSGVAGRAGWWSTHCAIATPFEVACAQLLLTRARLPAPCGEAVAGASGVPEGTPLAFPKEPLHPEGWCTALIPELLWPRLAVLAPPRIRRIGCSGSFHLGLTEVRLTLKELPLWRISEERPRGVGLS